jgi:hypothetical protein
MCSLKRICIMVGPVATGRYFKEINPLGNIYSERESRPWKKKKKKTEAGLLPLFVLVVQPHSVKNSGKRMGAMYEASLQAMAPE